MKENTIMHINISTHMTKIRIEITIKVIKTLLIQIGQIKLTFRGPNGWFYELKGQYVSQRWAENNKS
jgi:hypothetical protein